MSNRPKSELEQVEGSFKVRFNGFADLLTERHHYEQSPDIMCLGHKFKVHILPGGDDDSDDGMVAVEICNCTDQSISIFCSFSVRNSAGREIASCYDHKETPVFLDADGEANDYFYVKNFALRTTLLDALVDGALVLEVMIKQADPEELQKPFLIEISLGANMLELFNDEESADIDISAQTWVRIGPCWGLLLCCYTLSMDEDDNIISERES